MADDKGLSKEGLSPQSEEEILSFWRENKIFEKSLEARKKGKPFVFYEGPPYANGIPGIHHVESRSFKDIILRYKTMRGFFAPRRAGWDTHGLPTEMAVEKALGIKSKREIEEKIGVEKFVEEAKKNVFTYIDAWEKLTERMGYWLDFENAYVTMANNYIESLWAVVSKISDRELLYEDYKVLPWCPRCGTSLSSHELAQGYKKVNEESIFVKFPIKGEKNKYFLAWTTTPWTLAGNVALALNPKINYVAAKLESGDLLILAEARLDVLTDKYEIVDRFQGKKILNVEYDALYPTSEPYEKIYKAVGAEFVSTEDGSGIVHIAPAFGGDDMAVGKKEKLPTLITVNEEGKMIAPEKPWDGAFIKKADSMIIEDLKNRGLLYKTQMYEHDYPFCWRCETPLMYFARSSWFFKTTAVKEKMLEENSKIDWHPDYLKDGRFGGWLKENIDWGISRERFWGAPLPVWRCEECKAKKIIGSLEKLDEFDSNPTKIILMRHGEALHNIKKMVTVGPEQDSDDPLTEKGKKDVRAAAAKLKKEKIDVIVTSGAYRTKQTSEIMAEILGIKKVEEMEEFYEILVKGFWGRPMKEFSEAFKNEEARLIEKPRGAENLRELRARVMDGLRKIREKYPGKNILIVSHGDPTRILECAINAVSEKEYDAIPELKPAEFRKINLHNWPYNNSGELDLHKPYIDSIKLKCTSVAEKTQIVCGKEMSRVKEVIDVWFDSGAMPFASQGFDVKGKKPKLYPAEYITEGIDQTRGWFYTLLAVSALLGFGSSYKRVLSLGLVLDEKGNKMSKSKGNVVDPKVLIEKYGADSLRWYFYTINQPWDDKLFREKDIQDAGRRFFTILWNSYVYWKTYGLGSQKKIASPKLVINRWLIAKWNSVLSEVIGNLEKYDTVSAARKIENFVTEDLSRWYIRRIREHMKQENSPAAKECASTLGFVLAELSRTLAPFAPFASEKIYKELSGKKKSVHLEDFPSAKVSATDTKLIEDMEKVREIVSKGLEARQKAGIKIRQPLSELKFKLADLKNNDLEELIKGEVNVKAANYSKEIENEVELDINITQELREEGLVREFIRQVQDFRKELKLTPQDKVKLYAKGGKFEKILSRQEALIKKEINISELIVGKIVGSKKDILIDSSKGEIGIK